MNSDFPNLKAVMDLADVVLEVLDARDPLTYRSSHLEEYVLQRGSGVKLAFVLNKIGTHVSFKPSYFLLDSLFDGL